MGQKPGGVTVIDVGCHDWEGGADSIDLLARVFRPTRLIGLDPFAETGTRKIGGTRVETLRAAAATYDGEAGMRIDGTASRFEDGSEHRVLTVDLARLVAGLDGDMVILKLDCEGSEYDLLEHLIGYELDERLALLLVEWHRLDLYRDRQQVLAASLRCPVGSWWI